MSRSAIAEELGIGPNTASKWISLGRQRGCKLFYISGWVKGATGVPTALFMFGPSEKDAEKPRALTQREYDERARIKRKALSSASAGAMALLTKTLAK